MESIKKENERILRAQEELNQILMEKFQTEGRGRRSESEDASHPRKSKKLKHTKLKVVRRQKCLVNDKVTILLVIVVMMI